MRLHLCIGFLESRDGPMLGLRQMVQCQVLPQFSRVTVQYHSWRDDLCGALTRQAATTPPGGPLILLGHSYGASALVRAARRVAGISIDHLILLDPVPRWLWGQFQWFSYKLPANVRRATCLYNPWSLPKSSPIRNAGTPYRNVRVPPLHASIPGDSAVQEQILAIIRQEWNMAEQLRPRTTPPPLPGVHGLPSH